VQTGFAIGFKCSEIVQNAGRQRFSGNGKAEKTVKIHIVIRISLPKKNCKIFLHNGCANTLGLGEKIF
jgi:hypothetical protein